MNVLMLVKDSEIGGVASCVKSLAEGLEKYKNVHTVIGIKEGESLEYMFHGFDVQIIDFATKNLFKIIRNYRLICRLVKKKSIDIIHAQNRIPAYYAGVYCFFHRKVPYIWSNHLVPLPSDFIHRVATRYGSCAVAEGIAGEEMLVNDFRIPKNKVAVVNLGVDFEKFKKATVQEQNALVEKYQINKDERIILLYGRLHPVKGHQFLLEALRSLIDEKFRLVFPGENESYKETIIECAEAMGITDKIIFPGYIRGYEWLSVADLMVLPSEREGFGIVNVEAFVMGVPVIRTKTGGYEDMKDLCFGVEYGDVNALTALLKKFFEKDKMFDEKVLYAKEHTKRFSLKEYTDKYYEIYVKALGKGNEESL